MAKQMKVLATDPVFGLSVGEVQLTNLHDESTCAGEHCVVHNPSNHAMRGWVLVWRADKGIMERQCPRHGVGHPDPDDLAFHIRSGREYLGVHGCCGCCSSSAGASAS